MCDHRDQMKRIASARVMARHGRGHLARRGVGTATDRKRKGSSVNANARGVRHLELAELDVHTWSKLGRRVQLPTHAGADLELAPMRFVA